MFQLRMKLAACVAVSSLTLAITASAGAQTVSDDLAENGESLNMVVIKGQREGGAVLNPPEVLTNHIDATAIARRQVNDVRDIGRLDPAINYNSRTQGFVIRGLSDNRILTTIDGINVPWLHDPARGAPARDQFSGGLSFDFNALSSLDVIRGSDSSLYGSGALGGIVAVRTLEPEDLLTDEKNWASVTKGSYDSIDKNWRVDQAFALRTGDTTMLLQGSYTRGKERKNHGTIGGYGTVRTKAETQEFDQNNFMFKAYHTVDNSHRFGLTLERFDQDRERKDFLAAAATYVQGTKWDAFERQRERVSLSYDFTGEGFLDEAHAVVYWQRQQLVDSTSSIRLPSAAAPGAYMRRTSMEDESYGVLASGVKGLEVGQVNHKLRFATDLRFSQSQQYSAGQDNCGPPPFGGFFNPCWFLHTNQADAPNTDSTVFGFTIEDEISFFDQRLRVIPGLRFDYFKHEPKKTLAFEGKAGFTGYPRERNDHHFSPKLRIEMDAGENWTLYAQYAQGFRAPSVAELYEDYINPGRYYIRGNPDLEPETSHGFDVGAKFGNHDFGGSVSFFANRYRNFIDAVELGAGGGFALSRQEYINRAKVSISGVEAKAHWQLLANWRLHGALAYTQGKDIIRDEYLNSIPAFKTVVGLEYAQENWGGDVTLTAVAKRDKVETGSHDLLKTPGYGLVDVTAWWQPIEKGPRLQAGVYNLFDKKYWDAVSLPTGALPQTGQDYAFYSEPGRSFKFSIVQKF